MIHPTAIVHPGVELGIGSSVGPYCIIGDESGTPLKIGEYANIRSHTVIYGGSEYGPHLETGHFALLRSGNSVGKNLRIGSYSSLEGGATIGDYVRLHGRFEVTKGIFNHFARVYGGSYITDNRRPPSRVNHPPVVDECAVICMNSVLVAGFRVGRFAYVGAGIVIDRDVPDGHMLLRDGTTKPLRTFWPNYPESIVGDYPIGAQWRIWKTLRDVRHLASDHEG